VSAKQQRFAQVVLKAFVDAGRATDKEVGEAGGPSTSTMTTLRKVARGGGTMRDPRPDSLRKIERAARWTTGSARALWETGAEPTVEPRYTFTDAVRDFPPGVETLTREEARIYFGTGLATAVERLTDRVLELEERLDLLEDQLSEGPARTGFALAADEDGSIAGEQESTNDT
jgi:hypothetical protein